MPVEQPQKFGLDQFKDNPELEVRLRKIERELTLRQTNTVGQAADSRLLSDTLVPPAPAGLGAVPGLDVVLVIWDSVDIGNLKEYEVQIDTEENFPTPTIFRTTLLNHEFVALDSNTDHFVRVRAISTGGIDGVFTGTLNTTTGQVQASDIADGAVTTVKLESGASGATVVTFAAAEISMTTAGADLATATITPSNIDSTIVVMFSVNNSGEVGRWDGTVENNSAQVIWDQPGMASGHFGQDSLIKRPHSGVCRDSPGSIDPQTYTVKGISQSPTYDVSNRGMFLYEIVG